MYGLLGPNGAGKSTLIRTIARVRFLNLLSEIGERVVVILSTHIVDDVSELCSRMPSSTRARFPRGEWCPSGAQGIEDRKPSTRSRPYSRASVQSARLRASWECRPCGPAQTIGDNVPKYLFLQRSVPGQSQRPSPAQMQEMYAAFNAWKEKFKDRILDMGGPLTPGGKIVTSSGATDGPFVEAKEIIGGYMLVSADNFEQALEVARESPPVLMPGSSVEVREIRDMDAP